MDDENFLPIAPEGEAAPPPVVDVPPADPVPEPVPDASAPDLPEVSQDQTEAPTVEDVLAGDQTAAAPAPVIEQTVVECHPWEQHPAMVTDFSEYCVTEALLLLIFVLAFIRTGWMIISRWL